MKKKSRSARANVWNRRRVVLTIAITVANIGIGVLGANAYLAATSVSPMCGDAVRNASGEQCDDGNRRNGDGCSSRCTVETKCGNGRLDRGEQCDDRNKKNGDGCSEFCKREICGDGIVQAKEQCDDGNRNNGDKCPNDCKPDNCGDRVIGKGEECDDGDRENGDGCSSLCLKETRCIPGMPGCVPGGSTISQ